MKSLRNKVILSGIVLLFAFMATVGSTYAWFTVSSSAEVEEMTLNVTAAENLLIRVKGLTEQYTDDQAAGYVDLNDPSNYDSNIALQDLIDGGYQLQADPSTAWRLQPATILYDDGSNTADGKFLTYFPNVNSRSALTTAGDLDLAIENNNNGHYIKLEFWMLSQDETSRDVEMSTFSITADNTITERNAVANAVRLSVWFDDSVNGGGGTEEAVNIYGMDTDYGFDFDDGLDNPIAPAAASNFPVKTPTTIETTNPVLKTVEFEVPTLITVLIYIEGWDLQASDDIILANFDISFGFKYVELP